MEGRVELEEDELEDELLDEHVYYIPFRQEMEFAEDDEAERLQHLQRLRVITIVFCRGVW